MAWHHVREKKTIISTRINNVQIHSDMISRYAFYVKSFLKFNQKFFSGWKITKKTINDILDDINQTVIKV